MFSLKDVDLFSNYELVSCRKSITFGGGRGSPQAMAAFRLRASIAADTDTERKKPWKEPRKERKGPERKRQRELRLPHGEDEDAGS